MRRGHLYAFQSNRTDPDQYILKELALNSDREENLDIQFPPGTRLAARMRWGLKGLDKSRDYCRHRYRLWTPSHPWPADEAGSFASAHRHLCRNPHYQSANPHAQRILAGGSRGSSRLFHVHEFAVSPHCWRRGYVVGRLVAKKANRYGEAKSNSGIACL